MGLKFPSKLFPNNVFTVKWISIRIFVTSSKLGQIFSNKIHEYTNGH